VQAPRGAVQPGEILTAEAIDILATKLRTPLQLQLHLTLALEAGYQTGEKPVTAKLVETVLSRQLDDLELTLAGHGHRLDMNEQFDAKAAEIRAMFSNQLGNRSARPKSASVCWRRAYRYEPSFAVNSSRN
jgi:hypothetical protein